MRILVTKDASTKIPREVADLDEARQVASLGFSVELLNDDDSTEPLPPAEEPQAEPEQASVEAEAETLVEAAPAKAAAVKPAAKKSAPAKKAAAKRR